MSDRKPSKPWRVQRAGSVYRPFSSQAAAYENAADLAGLGIEVVVWHWKRATGGCTSG